MFLVGSAAFSGGCPMWMLRASEQAFKVCWWYRGICCIGVWSVGDIGQLPDITAW